MAFSNINIAKNEVTGKFIKSDPPNELYISNYDKAFAKKTPSDWAKYVGVEIDSDSTEVITYKKFKEVFEVAKK
tara:strand:- start:253 stop:474 length:222 start_codon:yes stop_codon:yes gene_type:complete